MLAIKKDLGSNEVSWLCCFYELGIYFYSSLETMLAMAQKSYASVKLFYDLTEIQQFILNNPELFDGKIVICETIIGPDSISFEPIP